jgi:hypothetical protein
MCALVIVFVFQSVLVSDILPEDGISLLGAPWIPSFAVGIEVSSEHGAAMPNDSLPSSFPGWSLS